MTSRRRRGVVTAARNCGWREAIYYWPMNAVRAQQFNEEKAGTHTRSYCGELWLRATAYGRGLLVRAYLA